MEVLDIKEKLPSNATIIFHDVIESILSPYYSRPNDKIRQLVNNNKLIRLKKGFYIFSDRYRDKPIDYMLVANALYQPSYVSFEYALSYHGVIPERVNEVTSATYRNSKLFKNHLARFSYKKISREAYSLGIDWSVVDGVGTLVASKEKALCDKIKYSSIGMLSMTDMSDYLEYDLRVDLSMKYDIELISNLAVLYKSRNLRTLSKVLKKACDE